MEITTDKGSYIPGEIVILFADTNSEIQYAGLDYTVKNPNQEIVFEGTIFQMIAFQEYSNKAQENYFHFQPNYLWER